MSNLLKVNFWANQRHPYEHNRTVQDFLGKNQENQDKKIDPVIKDASAICTSGSCSCGLPSPD